MGRIKRYVVVALSLVAVLAPSAAAATKPEVTEPVARPVYPEMGTPMEDTALSVDLIDAGFENGFMPQLELVEIESMPGCYLEREAAESWRLLEQAAMRDGIDVLARYCYRSYSGQINTYEHNCPLIEEPPIVDPVGVGDPGDGSDIPVTEPTEPPLPTLTPGPRNCRVPTATPGSSNHGWGRAADLWGDGQLLTCESPVFAWLVEHAADYGWVHPPWAGCGMPLEEAWHWEWAGIQDAPTSAPVIRSGLDPH